MSSKSAAERFYGMPIPATVLDVSDENLTDQDNPDLVTAHVGANYATFGAIDKTLAGFVVLHDEGGGFTLADIRGDGAVWWQDHRSRTVQRRFENVFDWVLHWHRGTEAAAQIPVPVPQGRPSTPTLLHRYQWLVWLLSQPMRRPPRDVPHLIATAKSQLQQAWPESHRAALAYETQFLQHDPHLAIYWLWHSHILGDADERAEVLKAVHPLDEKNELVSAFAEVLTAGTFANVPVLSELTSRATSLHSALTPPPP